MSSFDFFLRRFRSWRRTEKKLRFARYLETALRGMNELMNSWINKRMWGQTFWDLSSSLGLVTDPSGNGTASTKRQRKGLRQGVPTAGLHDQPAFMPRKGILRIIEKEMVIHHDMLVVCTLRFVYMSSVFCVHVVRRPSSPTLHRKDFCKRARL